MTNFDRAFGDDARLLLSVVLPVAAVVVLVRTARLRTRARHPFLIAAIEAGLGAYVLLVMSITLIPSPTSGEVRHIDWALLSSDLGSDAQRTQAIGNLLLFAPVVAAAVVLWPWARRRRNLVAMAVVLPASVELVQLGFVEGRAVTVEDWFLGSLGGLAAGTLCRLVLCAMMRSPSSAGLAR